MSTGHYSVDQVESLLTCAVCLGRYNNPKLLPCQHTFCEDPCLNGLIDVRTRLVRCPECRAEHIIPRGGASSLPTNRIILSFLDLPTQPVAVPASSNTDSNDTTTGDTPSRCALCNNNQLLTSCVHCSKDICDSCRKSHLQQVKLGIGRMVNLIRRGVPQLANTLSSLEQRTERTKQQCERVKAEVSSTVEKLIKQLKEREKLLHSELDAFKSGETRSLRLYAENYEVDVASLSSYSDSIESLMNTGNLPDRDMVDIWHQCNGQLQYMSEIQGSTTLPSVHTVSFRYDLQPVTSQVMSFGELAVSTSGNNSAAHTLLHVPTSSAANINPHTVTSQGNESGNHSLSNNRTVHNITIPVTHRTQESDVNDLMVSLGFDTNDGLIPADRVQRHLQAYQSQRSSNVTRNTGQSNTCNNVNNQSSMRTGNNQSDRSDRRLVRERMRRIRTPVTFDIPLDETLGDIHINADDLSDTDENRVSFRYSTADSLIVTTPRVRYQNKGQPVGKFGSRGSDRGRFTWPRGVAVSSQGDILVADSSNHRVQIFSQTGRFLKTFGSYGQGDGEFDCLAGLTVNNLGHIIVADRYNHRIQLFDQHGNYRTQWGTEGDGDGQLSYPWGVASNNQGFVGVCDKENHRIQIFQADGTFVRKFGELGQDSGHFENPHYIAISSDNKVMVSDSSNHRVQVFSIHGDYLFGFGSVGTLPGLFKYPRGIAVDEQGFLIVADSGNNRIQVFRGNGQFYSTFGSWGSGIGQLKGIEGLALTPSGHIVVADRENHRIQIF